VIQFRLLALFAMCWTCLAADTALDTLRSSLVGMRGQPDSSAPRGATPQLTIVKHQLRDWVESRLGALAVRGDEREFERKLNAELSEAKLFCCEGKPSQPQSPNWTLLGYLGDLHIHRSGGFLILQTAAGIECGSDQSAYVYSWSGEGWRRVWQNEQNTYTEKGYKPQILSAILISPYSKGNDYVVLTLGIASWCTSNLHPFYYRAFRLGPDWEAPPLVEGSEVTRIGSDPPIRGSVTATDILVEFDIPGGLDNYEAVRHYRIDHDQVKRVDPLALNPGSFVREWLTHDWRETALWSESANRRSTREWHTKLHKDFVSGEFIYPTMHCPSTPDLWQVGIEFNDPATPIGAEPKGTYFLVRWRPPYTFRMVQVSDRPFAGCTEEDRNADETLTLFPAQ